MIIEKEILKALSVMTVPVYWLVAPLKTPAPYVVYSVPVESDSDVLCGQAETRVSIQIDCYSLKLIEAKELSQQAQSLLSKFYPADIMRLTGYEPDTKLSRTTVELSIII